jgi:virulence-associated protein VagC
MKTTKVFRSGNSQAVRETLSSTSRKFEILRRGEDIVLRRPRKSLAEVLDILTSFSADMFAGGRKQPKTLDRSPALRVENWAS